GVAVRFAPGTPAARAGGAPRVQRVKIAKDKDGTRWLAEDLDTADLGTFSNKVQEIARGPNAIATLTYVIYALKKGEAQDLTKRLALQLAQTARQGLAPTGNAGKDYAALMDLEAFERLVVIYQVRDAHIARVVQDARSMAEFMLASINAASTETLETQG